MKSMEWGRKALQNFGKYKYVLLVALVGAVLLLWPSGEKRERSDPGAQTWESADIFRVEELEEKLAKALSQVEGAGQVTVVLTLAEGPRQVLAQNEEGTWGSGETRRETSTVLLSRGTGLQEVVSLQEVGPNYRGALVVAEGGDIPQVRLALCEAVSALTGLGADKISICKGK